VGHAARTVKTKRTQAHLLAAQSHRTAKASKRAVLTAHNVSDRKSDTDDQQANLQIAKTRPYF